jgi:Tfp pilus assembly protein PilO
VTGLLAVAFGNGTAGRTRPLWRSRAALFGALGIVLLASGAVLVVYRLFYDARLAALSETRMELTRRRDEARAGLVRAEETGKRLAALKEGLDTFYGDTLGSRKERLASLIEDVDDLTRKAGFTPPTVTFSEDAVPGADRLVMSFQIEGRYADVKRLLYALETSPRFLVPERVQVTPDQNAPDILRVSLSVAHYFRTETPHAQKRAARGGAAAKGATQAAPSGPAAKVALE